MSGVERDSEWVRPIWIWKEGEKEALGCWGLNSQKGEKRAWDRRKWINIVHGGNILSLV